MPATQLRSHAEWRQPEENLKRHIAHPTVPGEQENEKELAV